MKVLVIGGSGFIGQTLIPTLLKDGHDVSVINRGRKIMTGVTQLIADRNSQKEMSKIAVPSDKYDVVIDTSAYTALQTEIAWTSFSDKTNHWIHLSSAAVYKETPGRIPSEKDIIGGPEVWGQYGIDKSNADEFLLDHTGKIPVTIFRPPYIYGPHNSEDRETFIWTRVLQGKTIVIPTHGETVMQFIHVEDLISAFKCAIESIDLRINDTIVYNVASDEQPTQNEWVNIVAEVTEMKYKAVCAGNKAVGFAIRQYFPFRDYPCYLDTALIKRELSWQAKYGLKEGFLQAYHTCDIAALQSKAIDTLPKIRF